MKIENWSKPDHFWEFPNFQEIFGKIPEWFEFWNSDFTINLCDLNWVGIMPKKSKLVQIRPFLGVSRNPNFQFSNCRKIRILNFWLQNQAQYSKLSGNYTQNVKIDPNQPISGSFRKSRFPIFKSQKILEVIKSVQNL